MRFACEGLSSWFEKGATIVTPSRLLAAASAQDFTAYQLGLGQKSWERTSLYDVDAWLGACWQQARYSDAKVPALLSRPQEQSLWQQVIEQEHERLFNARATARLAMRAAKLIAEWHIPLEGEAWTDYEDASVFQRWLKLFRRRCREEDWITRSDVWRLLPGWIASGACSRELTVFAGFRTFTPALEKVRQALGLFASLEELGATPPFKKATASRCQTFAEELTHAARWARAMFEREPGRLIAVFVSGLATHRTAVERTFDQVFSPGAALRLPGSFGSTDAASIFRVHAAAPLVDEPLVSSALLILELARPRVDIADAGAILRCPFIEAAQSERSARALADVALRRNRDLDVSIGDIEFASRECPKLQELWRRVRIVLSKARPPFELARWSELFADLLKAAGWPGMAELSRREQEVVEAWKDGLSRLEALGLVSGAVSIDSALSQLRRVLSRPGVARGDWASPIQVIDASEAFGLRFDCACIAGLSDEGWPPPIDTYPLVPLKLQRALGVPGSSQQLVRREREQMTEALFAAAPVTVATYSGRLAPIAERFVTHEAGVVQWQGKLPLECYAPESLFEVEDSVAPKFDPSIPIKGGTAIIKAQSQCPFRAFAEFRLEAKRPEDACFGFDARDRGKFLHEALQYLWQELRTQDRLRMTAEQELRVMVRDAVEQAVKNDTSSPFHELITVAERERLEELIIEWLAIERARKQPFTVETVERNQSFKLEGLPLELRVDRIDRLKNGTLVLIDYKSGKQTFKRLEMPRPAEPQLWVYATAIGHDVDGVFFAQMKARELRGTGFSREKHFDGNSAKVKGAAWDSFLSEAHAEMRRIAAGFVAGQAAVDPIRGACEYCNVKPFCRVNEKRSGEQEDE